MVKAVCHCNMCVTGNQTVETILMKLTAVVRIALLLIITVCTANLLLRSLFGINYYFE